ncbi:MAG: tetratricopeptide repeat protein [Ignavibacteriaceae bacterium]|nr:tetratricopeptide repeat protein [Ignavibacteriaceae bacterium]
MLKVLLSLGLIIMFIAPLSAQDNVENEAKKLYNEGNAKREAGDYQAAIALYQQSIDKLPDYKSWYNMGLCYKNLNQTDKAVDCFEEALKLKTDLDLAYVQIGAAYYAAEKYDSAIIHFEKVLEITTNNKVKNQATGALANSYVKLSFNAYKGNKFQEAIDNGLKAVAIEKNDYAYWYVAESYLKLGDNANAITNAKLALENINKLSKGAVHFTLGTAYKNLGDKLNAVDNFTKASADANYKAAAEAEIKAMK